MLTSLLGRRPNGRYRVIAALAAALVLVAVAGCAKMDAALSRQWVTVSFKPSTSIATLLHVRTACSHVANTPPLPIHRTKAAIDMIDSLQYNTTNSTNANVAELQVCLQKFPSVDGLNFSDASDSG